MKFLCDRCKTRYSIADERVRGKILKIRCKNCANVITVREGMEEPPLDVKTPMPTRAQPRAAIAPGAGVGGRPLEAAFATAMSSPGITVPPAAPAALEEEWYVSIDGNQTGPFSLAQAQAWVSGRSVDDELYCWSEGFDDWLPVEKVSHFRGLRGRARPRTEPPPVPTDSGRYLRPIDQSEPQPLFAATLAALEAEAPTSIGAPPVRFDDLMPRATASRPVVSARSATPLPTLPGSGNNGRAAVKPSLPGPGVARGGAPPLPGTAGKTPAPLAAKGPAPLAASPSGPVSAPAAGPASSPISSMFSKGPAPASSPANGSNGHDASSRPMFDDAGLDDSSGDGVPDLLSAGAARTGAAPPEENDDLAIGEVSRVVRIADIAKSATAPVVRRTPQAHAAARGTGSVPRFEQAALAASGDALAPMPLAMPLTGTESEIVQQLAQPPAPPRHTLLLVGGVGVVALLATLGIVFATGGEPDDPNAGPRIDEGSDSDISGISMEVAVEVLPKDPSTNPNPNPNPTGSGGRPTGNGGRPTGNGGRPTGTGGTRVEPDRSGLPALSGDDVVAMSNKMSTGPRRCYEQAKRKDPFLDVKRLRAVITVDKSGTVTKVELLDHANAQLDGCLAGAIGRWKFRENSDGLTSQVSFAFISG